MDDVDKEMIALRDCVSLCQRGFATHTNAYYERIATQLEPFKAHASIAGAIALANAGLNGGLSSPRFCYPHIESALKERLAILEALRAC